MKQQLRTKGLAKHMTGQHKLLRQDTVTVWRTFHQIWEDANEQADSRKRAQVNMEKLCFALAPGPSHSFVNLGYGPAMPQSTTG